MKANFLPLLIGSLPHTDVKAAVREVFDFLPHSPSWPQFPRISKEESMEIQFLEGIPCWTKHNDKIIFKKSVDCIEQISEKIEKAINKDVESFLISERFSKGFNIFLKELININPPKIIKGQVIGPITFLVSHYTDDGTRLLKDETYTDSIPRFLAMKAAYQVAKFREISPGSEPIIFFDEPILAEIGSSVTNLTYEQVRAALDIITENVNCLKGIHICGNSDWDFILKLPIDIINFDAYSFYKEFLLYKKSIKEFIEKGKYIALGVIPTDKEHVSKENKESLLALTMHIIEELKSMCCGTSIEEDSLNYRIFLTPSCGMGTLTMEESGKVLRLLRDLSNQLNKQ